MSRTLKWIAFFFIACFVLYDIAVQITPGVLTHQIMEAFKINAAGMGLLSSFYFWTYLIMQIPAGMLLDRFNLRRVVILPILITAFGLLIFSTHGSLFTGTVARFMMGFGTSFAFIAAAKISSDLFEHRQFSLLIGIIYFMAGCGALVAQVPLVLMTNHFGWRAALEVFAIAGIVLAILILLTARYQTKRENTEHLYYGHGWLALKAVLRHHQSWAVALVSFFTWGPVMIFAALWAVPFLMQTHNIPKIQAAHLNSWMWIGLGIGSLAIAVLSRTMKRRKFPMILFSLIGLASTITLLYDYNTSFLITAVLMFLAGFGCGTQALTYSVVKDIHHRSHIATAISFNNMMCIFAAVLFQPLSGSLITWVTNNQALPNTPSYTITNYHHGLILLPILFALSILCTLFFVKETHCKPLEPRDNSF